MRILLIGVGAEGLGLASFLAGSGVSLDLVCRPASLPALRTGGIHRTGVLGERHVPAAAFRVFTQIRLLPLRPYDSILVSTKSGAAGEVAGQLAETRTIVGPATRIVLFMNGWGNADPFLARFPKEQIFGARVITGFRRLSPNSVEVTVHGGDVLLGSICGVDPEAVAPLATLLTCGGIPAQTTCDLTAQIWEKLAYNCAVNGLGAIWDEPIGVVAAEPDACLIVDRVVEEVFAVMRAAGIPTRWPSHRAFLKHFYEKLLPATARHVSSTTADLRGRKRTEIDYLNGAVVRLGAENHVPVSENLLVLKAIRRVEAVYLQAEEGDPIEQEVPAPATLEKS